MRGPVGVAVSPCGCLVEQPRWWRLWWFRCGEHRDRYVGAEALTGLRRCESCRRRRAVLAVWFADGDRWRVCGRCEPWGLRR